MLAEKFFLFPCFVNKLRGVCYGWEQVLQVNHLQADHSIWKTDHFCRRFSCPGRRDKRLFKKTAVYGKI